MASRLLLACATFTLLLLNEVSCAGLTPAFLTGATAVGLTAGSTTVAAVPATALLVGTAAVVGALAGSGALSGVLAKRNFRTKRDASCFGISNPELMFVLAANSDQLGCGQRLVCELEATPDEELDETERLILDLFGRDIRPLKASQISHPRAAYHYAAQVGVKAASPAECAEVFDLCPLNRTDIMGAYAKYVNVYQQF